MERDRLETIRAVTAAFDAHDVDGIMSHFSDDAIFESPRGPNPYGQRFVGKAEIRDAFVQRFTGMPDVRYLDDTHFVAGDRGVSEWTLTGTTTDGQRIEVRGCDLWTFRDGKIVEKRSFWKIRTAASAV